MPEISRFLGIVIKMFFDDHNPPHFHAEYGEDRALVKRMVLDKHYGVHDIPCTCPPLDSPKGPGGVMRLLPTRLAPWASGGVIFSGVPGVSFEEAATALENERLLVISHTEVGDRIRIISARAASRGERRIYEEG